MVQPRARRSPVNSYAEGKPRQAVAATRRLPAEVIELARRHVSTRPCGAVNEAVLRRLTCLWAGYVLAAVVADRHSWPTVCPFRLLTHRRCPLCGLTRSTNAMLRGKVADAFREHRAGPLLVLGTAAWLAAAWIGLGQGASASRISDSACIPGRSTHPSAVRRRSATWLRAFSTPCGPGQLPGPPASAVADRLAPRPRHAKP